MDGFRTLKQGSRVSYELVQGPKGDLAQNIRPVDAEEALTVPAATRRPAEPQAAASRR
jgi:CspA family cold shock protein